MKKQNGATKRTNVADSTEKENDSRCRDLEKEKEAYKREVEELKCKLANPTPESVNDTPKTAMKDRHHKVTGSGKKSKSKSPSQFSSQRTKSNKVGVVSPDDIQRLKAEKVQLLCKLKLQSMQFRISKASLEKEVLQLKKEQRKTAYEMRKLLALNQKQKLVLQRKIEEADMATKRLKELLESRKALLNKNSGDKAESRPGYWAIELELKVAEKVEEIRSDFERQMEEMADEVNKYEEEAEALRQENFRFLVENKDVDCTVRDSELLSLKEEICRLNSLVSRMRMREIPKIHQNSSQASQVTSFVTASSSIEKPNPRMYESECSGGNVSMTSGSGKEGCCSCSKKSLCKTTKCECRVAGGCCSEKCGCVASKCSNRKPASKLDDSPKLEVSQELVQLPVSIEKQESIVPNQPNEVNKECEQKRKPLSNIGNIVDNASPVGIQKKKGSKLVNQAISLNPSLLPTNAEGSTEEDTNVVKNVPRKSKRATRSAISSKV